MVAGMRPEPGLRQPEFRRIGEAMTTSADGKQTDAATEGIAVDAGNDGFCHRRSAP